jgi:hypothetical protein
MSRKDVLFLNRQLQAVTDYSVRIHGHFWSKFLKPGEQFKEFVFIRFQELACEACQSTVEASDIGKCIQVDIGACDRLTLERFN